MISKTHLCHFRVTRLPPTFPQTMVWWHNTLSRKTDILPICCFLFLDSCYQTCYSSCHHCLWDTTLNCVRKPTYLKDNVGKILFCSWISYSANSQHSCTNRMRGVRQEGRNWALTVQSLTATQKMPPDPNSLPCPALVTPLILLQASQGAKLAEN